MKKFNEIHMFKAYGKGATLQDLTKLYGVDIHTVINTISKLVIENGGIELKEK